MAKDKEKEVKEVKKSEPKKSGYFMAPGKCLTSKKGMLESGAPVKAEFFVGGEATLNAWVEKKFIVKK